MFNAENDIDWNTIYFAGEKAPLDENHPLNREKFERELLVAEFNVSQFILYHKRSPSFFPFIEKTLKDSGIPDDFKYIAVAESGLRNSALSDKSAGGIWQFVPDTAKHYGLTVNDQVDERYSFEKATVAAARYFKKLHGDFSDWTLAAAAYNRGENGIRRAMDSQKTNNYYDLYLNDETSRYVYRILAIKYLMEHKNDFFSKDLL